MAVVLRNRNQAMTMMEILIVIALIAVLAALGITNLGGILGRSKESLAKSFLDGPMLAA
ncbi:MAG: type II secretion system GspH family protein, partial [Puniceicoccales bacterium]|nr:type II secretion system GspH family protein [Puniceicoccales bacterium]